MLADYAKVGIDDVDALGALGRFQAGKPGA